MAHAFTWPPWEVVSLRQKLDDLEALVRTPGAIDPDVLAWLSRMLVVRSSGFLEQAAIEVCRGHVREKSGGSVQGFALTFLERSRNPTVENLCDLVGRFGKPLEDEFVDLLDDDDQRLRREIGLMVDRRNRIAHGLNEGVTRDKALSLKDVSTEVADWFVLRFNPG